jgi:hypothetical protein
MLSVARAELYELFDEVTSNQGHKVVLQHRGSSREAALVGREYLERLERLAASPQAPLERFRLSGTATLATAPDAVLAAVRAEQRELADKKARVLDPTLGKRAR